MRSVFVTLLSLLAVSLALREGCETCKSDELCVPDAKLCFMPPCPQWKCAPFEEAPEGCEACDLGQVCVPDPKACFTTPCPQFRCENDDELGWIDSNSKDGREEQNLIDPCSLLMCPENFSPVCDNKGVTHSNMCEFEKAECRDETLKLASWTACDEMRVPEDECDRACADTWDPICGNNGITYPNECEFSAAACRDSTLAMEKSGECQVDMCDYVCPKVYDPVCGTDENTYSNDCELTLAVCQGQFDLRVKHTGACFNRDVWCREDMVCPKIYRPVCSSDGRTYENECAFHRAQCDKSPGQHAVMISARECPSEVKPALPECDSDVMCTMEYDPVCASDSQTYSNPCVFHQAQCNDPNLSMAFHGSCEEDIAEAEESFCDTVCGLNYTPVCGSDGVTYQNECFFSKAHCLDKSLTVAHPGDCLPEEPAPECGAMACPMIFNPVCGSDGKTYSNGCMLTAAACSTKSLQLAHDGPCVPQETVARCDLACPPSQQCVLALGGVPVCISDDDSGRDACLQACRDEQRHGGEECALALSLCSDISSTCSLSAFGCSNRVQHAFRECQQMC